MSPTPRRAVSVTNILVRFTLGILILGLAVGVFAALVATRPTPPTLPASETLRAVRLLTLTPVEVTRRWPGYGSARSLLAADLSAEIAATVVHRPEAIEPGVALRKGDLIVALDDQEFRARVERARRSIEAIEAERASLAIDERSWELTLALARENVVLLRNELERLQQAVDAQGATVVELDRLRRDITRAERDAEGIAQLFDSVPARREAIEARLGVERSNLALATIDLDRARIVAPFPGVLQEVFVRPGERVAPGSPIARIVNLERLEVPLKVPESATGDLAVGSRAILLASGSGDLSWTGAVARIAPEADDQTRTVTVIVEITQNPAADASTLLQPGRFVTARLFAREPIIALVAPRSAINADRVLRVDAEGRAQSVAVRAAFHVDQPFPSVDPIERQWAVLAGAESGVAPGDQIVISNLDELRPGMIVRAPPAPSQPPSLAPSGAAEVGAPGAGP